MLGLRTAISENSGVSAAQMTYGTTLRLPADFFDYNKQAMTDDDYATQLANAMSHVRTTDTKLKGNRKCFVHKELQRCSHVFLRRDMIKKSLTAPYEGPYKVLKRDGKCFTIQLPGRTAVISIDRLKPAFLLQEDSEEERSSGAEPVPRSNDSSTAQATSSGPHVTRSGRTVRPVVRFAL